MRVMFKTPNTSVGLAAVLLAIAMIAAPLLAAAARSQTKSDTKGATTSRAEFVMDEKGQDVSVDLRFSVKKAGVSGTGRGCMAFAVLDGNQRRFDSYELVGASGLLAVA